MAILFVHDHVDDRIDACTEINHDVAEDVQARPVHFLVEHLRDGDRKVASEEWQEDRENHFRDSPLIAFLFSLALVFEFRWFRQMESISIRDVIFD